MVRQATPTEAGRPFILPKHEGDGLACLSRIRISGIYKNGEYVADCQAAIDAREEKAFWEVSEIQQKEIYQWMEDRGKNEELPHSEPATQRATEI
jgi:hypothetical protein